MGDPSSTAVNPDLDRLHDLLIATNDRLSRSLDTITDPALAKGVVTEMREVVHRVDLVQSLLFTAASARIATAVARVDEANADLARSLGQINDLTGVVKSVGQFLTLVDKAIDIAKLA